MARDARQLAVVLLQFEPAWLALPRTARGSWAARVAEIAGRHPEVALRWFDADALGHGFSDFALCEFGDLMDYHFLWEELRDTELFSRPYLRIVDVHLGIERAYEQYEARQDERGRPRDERSTDAILDATLGLLAERGYRGLSLDDVVSRAGVGKGTVYRRWPTKPRIVAAAILAALARANPVVPSSGDNRRDLVTILTKTIRLMARKPFGPAVRALVSETMHDPDLAAAVKKVEQQRRAILRAVVRRAVDCGQLTDDPELIIDVLLGTPYFQLLVRQRRPRPELAEQLVDLIWRA